jgi:hypothetical protein
VCGVHVTDFDEIKLIPPNLQEKTLSEKIAKVAMNFRKGDDEPLQKKLKNFDNSPIAL